MEIKILQVFLGEDNLPYKDKERTVHFPIVGAAFKGASNTTKIRFYYDKLVEQDDEDTTTWVAVSKLPNGKIGSKVLESEYDEELDEHYALFELESFYTQYKGDLFISLQGYQGGVQVITDQDTGISQIVGTPTIQATGSIKLAINYATQFIGSGETSNVNFQRILADLGTKLGIRTLTERVDELPTVGQTNVFYAVPDTSDTNKVNIYVWNGTTQSYVWVGDNSLYLGDYYTREQGEQFESDIDNRVTSVENELSSVASGSPKGVYATLSDLETAYPTGTTGIYLVQANGHWYYWNGSAWTDGGVYQAAEIDNNSISFIKLDNTISKNVYSFEKVKNYNPLNYDGFYPNGVNIGNMYFIKQALDNTTPFYPRPYGKLYPALGDITGGFYYSRIDLPTGIGGNYFEVDLWLYDNISATNTFLFAFLSTAFTYNSIFTSLSQSLSNYGVGYKETVGNGTLEIDRKIGNWYHIKVKQHDELETNPSMSLLLGTNYMIQATGYTYISVPSITKETQNDLKYKNDVYNLRENSPLWGKKIAWRGDSIMNGLADNTNNVNGWLGRIAYQNNMTFENKATDGAIMTEDGVAGHHSICQYCTDFVMQNPDYVILDGGANDYFNRIAIGDVYRPTSNTGYDTSYLDTSTYCGALEMCFSKLIKAYPNAKIGFVIPYKMQTYLDEANGLNAYFSKAKEICEKWGIPFIDLSQKSHLNYNITEMQAYYYDMVHINSQGYDLTYNIIEEWLKTL